MDRETEESQLTVRDHGKRYITFLLVAGSKNVMDLRLLDSTRLCYLIGV
jgi:hypothetical protein